MKVPGYYQFFCLLLQILIQKNKLAALVFVLTYWMHLQDPSVWLGVLLHYPRIHA